MFFSVRYSLMPHITEIAAAEIKTGSRFSVYRKPCVPIAAEALRVTGIYVNNDGDMSLNGQAVVCETIDSAIVKLYNCLSLLKKKFPDQSHKQEDLVKQHFSISYDAHNAEADVEEALLQ